jgi:hypothetical protein
MTGKWRENGRWKKYTRKDAPFSMIFLEKVKNMFLLIFG